MIITTNAVNESVKELNETRGYSDINMILLRMRKDLREDLSMIKDVK